VLGDLVEGEMPNAIGHYYMDYLLFLGGGILVGLTPNAMLCLAHDPSRTIVFLSDFSLTEHWRGQHVKDVKIYLFSIKTYVVC